MKLLFFIFLFVSRVFAQNYKVTEDDVTFYLHTNFHLDGIQLTTENLKEVNASQPTKFIIHGWLSSHQADWVEEIAHSYLKKGDYNVIRVDWSGPAGLDAAETILAAPDVGMFVGKFIYELQSEQNVQLQDVHVIGHSAGSLVSGFTGKTVQKLAGSKVARITALDPVHSGILINSDPAETLYKEDAEVMDVIHTDDDPTVPISSIGLIDFYVNGGVRPQPGCLNDNDEACSHMRATWIFAEEVANEKGFLATKCFSEADFAIGRCKGNEQISMGSELDPSQEGSYFLTTNAKYPFSLE